MSSWTCMGCRTVYAVGIPACPQCGHTEYADTEGETVAKVSAEGGPTLYVAEGGPVPGDVGEGVRLVGPGAPAGTDPAGTGTDEPPLVSVAEQRAAGVPPEETVTIADQKAGAEPPRVPDPGDDGKGKSRPATYPKPI